jgi:uncharacterized protein (TIGR04562 family)
LLSDKLGAKEIGHLTLNQSPADLAERSRERQGVRAVTKEEISRFKNQYDFRSDVLDVIIGGKSSLDSPNAFQIFTLEEADRFIQSYGYDLKNPIEAAEILGNFHEALNFIRKYFLAPDNPSGLKLEIPRKIIELTDVRELLLLASFSKRGQNQDPQGKNLQNWACSSLKVMHTLSHIDKDLRTPYFSDIQKQIFDQFYKLIHRDTEGCLYLGEKDDDPLRVNLIAFETKPKKSRDSIIMKLLHKPENVAEDIFDRVGIRLITPSPLDALRVIKYLKDKMVVIPSNIKPSRSRNTLFNLDEFRIQLADALKNLESDAMDSKELNGQLEKAALNPSINPSNPHSSEFYRAIQFTCRQLIKLKNPMFEVFRDLRATAKETALQGDLLKILDRIDPKSIQKEVRFFYPYEVQIVDQKSAEENERGRSAHSEYKRAQVMTAMKRVMGGLMDDA